MRHSLAYVLITLLGTALCHAQQYATLRPVGKLEWKWKALIPPAEPLEMLTHETRTWKERTAIKKPQQIDPVYVDQVPDTIFLSQFPEAIPKKISFSSQAFEPALVRPSASLRFRDNAKYNVRHAGPAQGFFTNTLKDIWQDPSGAMWLASDGNGLCLDDGFTASIYDGRSGLPSPIIERLWLDQQERLWLCTPNGARYLKDNHLYTPSDSILANTRINAAYEDALGNIWFAMPGVGCMRLNGSELTLWDKRHGLPLSSVYEIIRDREGFVWLSLDKFEGFVRWRGDTMLHYPAREGMLGNIPGTFYEDDKGVWAGQFGGTLFRYYQDSLWKYLLNGRNIWAVYAIESSHQGMWLTSYSTGVFHFDGKQLMLIDSESGLKDRLCYHTYADRAGNLWVGSLSGGLNRIDENILYRDPLWSDAFPTTFWNTSVDPGGKLWLTPNGDLLSYIEGDSVTRIRMKGLKQFPEIRNVMEMAWSAPDTAWLTTYTYGIVRMTEKKVKYFQFPALGTYGNIYHSISIDASGDVWAVSGDNGLVRFDGQQAWLYSETEGLAGHDVMDSYHDSQGNLWVQHSGAGLQMIRNDSIGSLVSDAGLNLRDVNCMKEDRKGRIWLGTSTGSLYLLNEGMLFAVDLRPQSKAGSIQSILETRTGEVWVAAQLGLLRLQWQGDDKFNIRQYGSERGPFLNSFSRAVHEFPDGSIIWGSGNGVIRYDPTWERPENVPPTFSLLGVRVGSKELPMQSWGQPIQIQAGDTMRIQYRAIDWGYEHNLRFEYAANTEKDTLIKWIDLSKNTELEFANYPEGEYHIRIRAVGTRGTSPIHHLELIVLPHWYNSTLFRICAAIFLGGLIYLGFRVRVRQMRLRERELKRIVEEKTELLVQEKEVLAKQNVVIDAQRKEKEALLGEVHHRVKNNLSLLSGIVHLQRSNSDSKEVIRALEEVEERIRSMAILHQRLYQQDQFAQISFSEYCHNLFEEIRSISGRMKGEVRFEISSEVQHINLKQAVHLALLLTELMTNAFKHAFVDREEGLIRIELRRLTGNQCALSVSDDGPGLPQQVLDTDRFSFGLNLVRILTRQLRGELSYENRDLSTFVIKFELEAEIE